MSVVSDVVRAFNDKLFAANPEIGVQFAEAQAKGQENMAKLRAKLEAASTEAEKAEIESAVSAERERLHQEFWRITAPIRAVNKLKRSIAGDAKTDSK